jgi:hypothetical protein
VVFALLKHSLLDRKKILGLLWLRIEEEICKKEKDIRS